MRNLTITIEQIAQHDQIAAGHVAELRDTAAAGYSHQAAKPGHRGLVVGRLKTLSDDARHEFVECVFGIVGGSSHGLTSAQCNALLSWIDANDSAISDIVLIVAAFQEVKNAETEKENTVNEKATGQEQEYWLKDDVEKKFLEFVRATRLSKAEVFEVLTAAITVVERLDLQPQDATHGEALVTILSDVYAPDGTRVGLNARQGATGDDVAATALAWWEGWQKLQDVGWTQASNGRVRRPAPETQAQGDSAYLDTEFVKFGKAKSSAPTVEFWNSGRKYPEIRWTRDLSDLWQISKWLGKYLPGNSDDIAMAMGKDTEFPVRCRVFYSLSEKLSASGKAYKNITKIEAR